MNTKKLGIAAGLAAVAMFAARSLGPKLHEHCQSTCARKCDGPNDKKESTQHSCAPQATREAATAA